MIDADDIVDRFDFTPPVEVADCRAVRDALKSALPEGARIEVYHRHADVVIDVRHDGQQYKRTKKVV